MIKPSDAIFEKKDGAAEKKALGIILYLPSLGTKVERRGEF